MSFDRYVWKAPRILDPDEAEALLRRWSEAGGDPSTSPFEPSSDVGWFYRELTKDMPGLETRSDAVRLDSSLPICCSAYSFGHETRRWLCRSGGRGDAPVP
jgi:hypothetical protein